MAKYTSISATPRTQPCTSCMPARSGRKEGYKARQGAQLGGQTRAGAASGRSLAENVDTHVHTHGQHMQARHPHTIHKKGARVQCSYTGRNSPPLVAILAASVADAVGHVVRTVRAEMPLALARVADARVMLARRAHVLDVAVAWVRHRPAQQGVSNHREHTEHTEHR